MQLCFALPAYATGPLLNRAKIFDKTITAVLLENEEPSAALLAHKKPVAWFKSIFTLFYVFIFSIMEGYR